MATILRSSKYIRCLNCFTRRITVAHDKSKLATKCIAIQAQCINSRFTKNYATAAAIQRPDDPVNYTSIFNSLDHKVQRYGRIFHSEIEKILSNVRDTGHIPSRDALLLIHCCGDLMVNAAPAQRNHLVQEIWSTLNTLNIPMDISHFNALLRVYLENGYKFSPIEFLTNLKEKGIEPNRVTYQRLIMYYCNHGDIDGATKILEFMKEKGIPLTEGIFNALITGHSEANDMDSAKNILNIMKEVDVAPNATTYTALLCAYAKRGDIESIKTTLQEISEKDIQLQDKDFLTIVQALAANGHDDEVDEVLSMISTGPHFNIEAVHTILKVLDFGNVNAALKILRMMERHRNGMYENETDGKYSSGTFLIKKLVNSKYSADVIIEACTHLEQQGSHNRAFNVATERALANGDIDLGVKLLRAWKENGATMREHYFWPLIVSCGRASNYQGIYEILKFMANNCNVKPSFDTIKDWVLPYTVGKWDETMAAMKDFNVPQSTILSAIANRMLSDKKIRKTAVFMTRYPVNYLAEPFYRPLAEALSYTGDAKSFTVIMRLFYDSAVQRHEQNENKSDTVPDEVIDNALRTMLNVVPATKAPFVDDVLTQLVETGITIKPELADAIRQYFQENMTQEIDTKLIKLASGTLELTPLSEFNTYSTSSAGGGDEANSIKNVGADGIFSSQKKLLRSTLKTGNIEAIKPILDTMESLNFNFSPALCAQIIHVMCTAGDLEMAEKWVNKWEEQHPSNLLDIQKVTNYAALLLMNDRFDDALQTILQRPRTEDPEHHSFSLKRTVRRLLDIVAESGNVEKTTQMFNALIEAKYTTSESFMLGALVKVHLNRNDLEGALAAFENICIAYQCTPLKNTLSKRFIDAEDANSLQRLTDLATQIHGESNALFDLVLSFLECGRVPQARKILETPGLRVRMEKVKNCADRYLADGKTERLSQFIELTRNLQTVDRQELYDVFLQAYSNVNDWQGALSLWTVMQDEDVIPKKTFLSELAMLLTKNNQPVPFVYRSDQIDSKYRPTARYVQDFRTALGNGNLDEAQQALAKVPKGDSDLSSTMSELIKEYASQKDFNKACKLVDTLLLEHGREPRASSLKFLWNSMINAGEFDLLREHSRSLSYTIKKTWRFQKYLNRASLLEHGLDKCLDDLQSKLTDSKTDNLNLIVNTVHFTAYLQELKKNPTSLEKFKLIAERLAVQEIYLPINMLWCYYFETNNPDAEELWSKYLSNSNWIVFNYLIDESITNKDIDLLERLYKKICSSSVLTTSAKAIVLSKLIEMYNIDKRYDDAVNVLVSTLPQNIEYFRKKHRKVFNALKFGLEASGKPYPFVLQDTRQRSERVSNEYGDISAVE